MRTVRHQNGLLRYVTYVAFHNAGNWASQTSGLWCSAGYDSRFWGLRFSQFFQHGSTPKPYNNIMLPCDSGADESNYSNSDANFPPTQIMQLHLMSTLRCSVNYSNNNNKSRDHFWFLIGEVLILLFRFRCNIDTTMTPHTTVWRKSILI